MNDTIILSVDTSKIPNFIEQMEIKNGTRKRPDSITTMIREEDVSPSKWKKLLKNAREKSQQWKNKT